MRRRRAQEDDPSDYSSKQEKSSLFTSLRLGKREKSSAHAPITPLVDPRNVSPASPSHGLQPLRLNTSYDGGSTTWTNSDSMGATQSQLQPRPYPLPLGASATSIAAQHSSSGQSIHKPTPTGHVQSPSQETMTLRTELQRLREDLNDLRMRGPDPPPLYHDP